MPALRHRSQAWFLFAIAGIAAWSFSMHGWPLSWYTTGRYAFLFVTLGAAVLVLVASERAAAAAAVLALGLLFANWSLVKMAAALAMWSINGFAR